jgi:hypothetical protein
MRTTRNILALGAAMAVLTAGAAPLLVGAADHLDSPNARANGALDITDIYAFDGDNSAKTVLVVDVNPLAGMVSGTEFATDAEYRFNVDSNGDFVADDVYTVTFGPNASGPKQSLSLARNGTTILTGKTGNANNGGGAKVYAGIRDDPFFFDLAGFLRWREGVDPHDGNYTYDGSTNLDLGDFFKGTNVSTIVLEIPDSWLGSSANFWATTVKDGAIVDRMGKPALNTVFMNPFGGTTQKDPYNQTAPSADVATWGGQFRAVEQVFYPGDGGATCGTATPSPDCGLPAAIAGLLLPDVLRLDIANLGKSTGTGFTGGPGGILNGRTLAEDVIDLELLVVTGGLAGHPVLSTDNVGANDTAFPGSFPYLAPAH